MTKSYNKGKFFQTERHQVPTLADIYPDYTVSTNESTEYKYLNTSYKPKFTKKSMFTSNTSYKNTQTYIPMSKMSSFTPSFSVSTQEKVSPPQETYKPYQPTSSAVQPIEKPSDTFGKKRKSAIKVYEAPADQITSNPASKPISSDYSYSRQQNIPQSQNIITKTTTQASTVNYNPPESSTNIRTTSSTKSQSKQIPESKPHKHSHSSKSRATVTFDPNPTPILTKKSDDIPNISLNAENNNDTIRSSPQKRRSVIISDTAEVILPNKKSQQISISSPKPEITIPKYSYESSPSSDSLKEDSPLSSPKRPPSPRKFEITSKSPPPLAEASSENLNDTDDNLFKMNIDSFSDSGDLYDSKKSPRIDSNIDYKDKGYEYIGTNSDDDLKLETPIKEILSKYNDEKKSSPVNQENQKVPSPVDQKISSIIDSMKNLPVENEDISSPVETKKFSPVNQKNSSMIENEEISSPVDKKNVSISSPIDIKNASISSPVDKKNASPVAVKIDLDLEENDSPEKREVEEKPVVKPMSDFVKRFSLRGTTATEKRDSESKKAKQNNSQEVEDENDEEEKVEISAISPVKPSKGVAVTTPLKISPEKEVRTPPSISIEEEEDKDSPPHMFRRSQNSSKFSPEPEKDSPPHMFRKSQNTPIKASNEEEEQDSPPHMFRKSQNSSKLSPEIEKDSPPHMFRKSQNTPVKSIQDEEEEKDSPPHMFRKSQNSSKLSPEIEKQVFKKLQSSFKYTLEDDEEESSSLLDIKTNLLNDEQNAEEEDENKTQVSNLTSSMQDENQSKSMNLSEGSLSKLLNDVEKAIEEEEEDNHSISLNISLSKDSIDAKDASDEMDFTNGDELNKVINLSKESEDNSKDNKSELVVNDEEENLNNTEEKLSKSADITEETLSKGSSSVNISKNDDEEEEFHSFDPGKTMKPWQFPRNPDLDEEEADEEFDFDEGIDPNLSDEIQKIMAKYGELDDDEDGDELHQNSYNYYNDEDDIFESKVKNLQQEKISELVKMTSGFDSKAFILLAMNVSDKILSDQVKSILIKNKKKK